MIRGVRNYANVTLAPKRRFFSGIFCDHVDTVSIGGIPCDTSGVPVDTVPKALTYCKFCGKLLCAQPLDDLITMEAEHGY